jgi:hypothetical protein
MGAYGENAEVACVCLGLPRRWRDRDGRARCVNCNGLADPGAPLPISAELLARRAAEAMAGRERVDPDDDRSFRETRRLMSRRPSAGV